MHAIKKVAAIWIIFCTVIIASNFLHRPPPLRDTSEPSSSGCRYSLGWIRVFGSVCPDRNSLIRTPDQDSSEICICKSLLSINTVRRRSFVHFDIVTHDKKKNISWSVTKFRWSLCGSATLPMTIPRCCCSWRGILESQRFITLIIQGFFWKNLLS